MKKIILLIITALFLFHVKSNSQTYKELKTDIELPRLQMKNKKLEKGLGSELIKNNKEWHPSYVYLLCINEDGSKKKSYKLTVTISTVCDINKLESVGFFEIKGYMFIVKGAIQSSLYSLTTERRLFECIKYYRENDGVFEPVLPIKWEPPIWIYSFKRNKLKCIEVKTFN